MHPARMNSSRYGKGEISNEESRFQRTERFAQDKVYQLRSGNERAFRTGPGQAGILQGLLPETQA